MLLKLLLRVLELFTHVKGGCVLWGGCALAPPPLPSCVLDKHDVIGMAIATNCINSLIQFFRFFSFRLSYDKILSSLVDKYFFKECVYVFI